MRNFKRFLTLALAMVMLVSAFAMGTSAAKFTDVDEENENYLAVEDEAILEAVYNIVLPLE